MLAVALEWLPVSSSLYIVIDPCSYVHNLRLHEGCHPRSTQAAVAQRHCCISGKWAHLYRPVAPLVGLCGKCNRTLQLEALVNRYLRATQRGTLYSIAFLKHGPHTTVSESSVQIQSLAMLSNNVRLCFASTIL